MTTAGTPRVSTLVRLAYRKSALPCTAYSVRDDGVGRHLPDLLEGGQSVTGALDREPLVFEGEPQG